jgi:hypothetical protein
MGSWGTTSAVPVSSSAPHIDPRIRAPYQEEADAVACVARQFRHPHRARPYIENAAVAHPRVLSASPDPIIGAATPWPPRPRRYAQEP